MTFRVAGVVLALASAVLFGSMGWARSATPHPAVQHVVRTTHPSTAIRNTLDAVAAFDECVRSVRRELPQSPLEGSRNLAQLDMATGVATADLAGCQNDQLAAVTGAVTAMRTTAPWDVVHAAAMAQADGQQAGLVLGQMVLLLRHVSLVGGLDHLAAKTAGEWSSEARSFFGSIVRLDRRRRQLRRSLAPTNA